MAVNLILTYDISDDDSRSRVAAVVSAWGDRIQRSVYQLAMEDPDLAQLLARIESLIDVDHDAVNVFMQCQACAAKAAHVGQATLPAPQPYWIL